MKDLGTKIDKESMYPSVEKNKTQIKYPSFDLPLDIIKGLGLEVDDEVEINLVGRISGLQDTTWTKCVTIEAKQGEVTKKEKEKKSTSILDENK